MTKNWLHSMNELLIFKTNYWVVSHRSDSRYPGYLMVSSSEKADDIHQLSAESLLELGNVLRAAERLLISSYTPYKVIVAKLGFSKGYSCHFHVLPISSDLLRQVAEHPNYTNDEPDGVDALFFVNREYCDKPLSKQQHEEMTRTIMTLVEQYKKRQPFDEY